MTLILPSSVNNTQSTNPNSSSGQFDESILDNIYATKQKSTDRFSQYNHLRLKSASDYAQGPLFYIFMTAPQLNFDNTTLNSIPFLATLNNEAAPLYGKSIINSLNYGAPRSNILTLLTSQCEGFTPLDIAAQTINHAETWTKLRHAYPGEDNDSRSAGTFSIEYKEKPGLPVLKTHKAWYEYIQACRRGYVKRAEATRKLRCIDYYTSLYYFLIAEDHETIMFWAKYTGIVPTGLPYSAFEGKKGGGEPIKVTIPYSFVYKEEMEPEILIDFNAAVIGSAASLGTGENLFNTIKSYPGRIGGYTTSLFKDLAEFLNPFSSDIPKDILSEGIGGQFALPIKESKGVLGSQSSYIDDQYASIMKNGGPSFAYVARGLKRHYQTNATSGQYAPILVFDDIGPQ